MADFSLQDKKIWVAGHSGLVGSALLRRLEREPCEVMTATHAELDLTRQVDTEEWIAQSKPDAIILAAAKVGGIGANSEYPAEFIYQNMAIAQNVIHGAHKSGVSKLLYLGSSCIYPRETPQPISEEALLSGALEPTNEAYAVAKIAGLKLAQFYRRQYGCDFISAMPTNLYGPGDSFDAEGGHVIPALMQKIHDATINGAPEVEIWGSGKPLREFLHVDDMADALVLLLQKYSDDAPVNIGSSEEVSIAELAEMIKNIAGFKGKLVYNSLKPDGVIRKVMDNSRIFSMGWKPALTFENGLKSTYDWYSKIIAHNKAA